MRYRCAVWHAALAAMLLGITPYSALAQGDARPATTIGQESGDDLRAPMPGALISSRIQQASNRVCSYELVEPEETVVEPGKLTPPGKVLRASAEKPAGRAAAERYAFAALSAPRKVAPDPVYDLPPAPGEQKSPFREEEAGQPSAKKRFPQPDITYTDGLKGLQEPEEPSCGCGETNLFEQCWCSWRNWGHLSLFGGVDAFKGPLDLNGGNGNFGVDAGINAAFPLARQWGIGMQAGTAEVLSDFHGTQFTGAGSRRQNFTTVGLFQYDTFGCEGLKWGFTFDWLFDHYFDSLTFQEWRVKLAYEWDDHEVGIWSVIPGGGGRAQLTPVDSNVFEPIAQGNFYYRHYWWGDSSTTAWIGLAEHPGEFIFGADSRIAVSERVNLVGTFNYILPNASGGLTGRSDEMWNLSVGIEIVPRQQGVDCRHEKFVPFLPVADNGTFAIRRIR